MHWTHEKPTEKEALYLMADKYFEEICCVFITCPRVHTYVYSTCACDEDGMKLSKISDDKWWLGPVEHPDSALMKQARQDYEAGNYVTKEEFLEELRERHSYTG